MRSFNLITALLLCSLSWICVSGSESQTVEVQSGQEVTLLCSNISTTRTPIEWFRVVNRTKPSCISSMYFIEQGATPCDGFQNGKFEMTSNVSTVFLKIKRVDVSDSGLYFCGFYIAGHTVIATATHLSVQGDAESNDEVDLYIPKEPEGMIKHMSMFLVGLTVFLTVVIIGLAVKIKKLQTAVNEEAQPEKTQNVHSDELNYAALTFNAKAKRNRQLASERELDPNVVYAVTRGTAARPGTEALTY